MDVDSNQVDNQPVNASEPSEKDEREVSHFFDTPILEGKRQRTKIDKWVPSAPPPQKKVEVLPGKGDRLRDIPNVDASLSAEPVNGKILKMVHRILFGSDGQKTSRRRHIMMFSGMVFQDEHKEREKLNHRLEACTQTDIDKLYRIFDLVDRSRAKEEKTARPKLSREDKIVNILKFLDEPKPSGNRPRSKEKKRSARSESDRSAKKIKTATGAAPADDRDSDSETSEDDASESDIPVTATKAKPVSTAEPAIVKKELYEKPQSDESDSAESADETDSDKPKRKRAAKKAGKPKTVSAPRGSKKTQEKDDNPPRSNPDHEVKEESVEKKDVQTTETSGAEPSDEEIKEKIREILKGADTASITVKSIRESLEALFKCSFGKDKKTLIKNYALELHKASD